MTQSGRVPPTGRFLVIEDDADFRLALRLLLEKAGHEVACAETLGSACGMLADTLFDAALVDLTLPDAHGERAIRAVLEVQPSCGVLVLTGHNDAGMAVRALQLGALDYLTKPLRGAALLGAIEPVLERKAAQERLLGQGGGAPQARVLGDSPAWRAALRMLDAAAEAPRTTVLLTGEPGVGKEVAARLIHDCGAARDEPFVAVNVACLPAGLAESELFGHEAGAFTGATRSKRGVFERAGTGTLFLDEIGELPTEMQAKLLRVLEGQPFTRVGGERQITPRCRLLSATNQPLPELVRKGEFREDLYHRLRVLEIPLPPLRERGDDIRKLALHFLAELGAEMGRPRATYSQEALDLIVAHTWPGNVRELRNVVERALVLSRGGPIAPIDLPPELRAPASHASAQDAGAPVASSGATGGDGERVWRLDDVVRRHMQRALDHCDGNVTHAAELLGVTRQTLRRRLRGGDDG